MTYYPINEDTAKRANDANSFRDYKPGSATACLTAWPRSRTQCANKTQPTRSV